MTQIYFHPTVMYCFFRICSCNFSDGLQIVHGALLINRKFKKIAQPIHSHTTAL